ncbi:unnamed protein product [Symbiodinium natans]|uniref:EF-hand domain-containing protein n=1 Tax=Symbiodinium natans TaxID=878477 RepID=A0A812MWA4_9DINO|nr:unnamed protein product [Symbiodinium natans]
MAGPPPQPGLQAVGAARAPTPEPGGHEVADSPSAWAQQTMGRMAPLPQEEEESPTSTAHFPFGPLSRDPYDTFVKQQLMLLEDELRSLDMEDSFVQEQLRSLEAQLRARKPQTPGAQETLVSAGAPPRSRLARWEDEMLPNGKHTGTYSDVLQTQAGAMQMHERQVARQRQQLEYSLAELSRNPHGMSEGEVLRSRALEQRVQQLIERREQRERLRSGTPPRAAAPEAAPPVVRGPGSGATAPPGPTVSFVPFGGRSLPPEAGDGTFAAPEASRFHLDPSAVMTARNWSPGHSRPDVARFDLDPVTQRDWARPGAVPPDRNYTPNYVRPALVPVPGALPGPMSQDASPVHDTAPTLYDPTSPHAASSGQRSQPSWRSRSASPGPALVADAFGDHDQVEEEDPVSLMEQSRKAAEDALYQNEAGRKKAERERQKTAEERKKAELAMQRAEEERLRAEQEFAEAEQTRREEAKQRQRDKRGAAMRKQQDSEKKRREEEEDMRRMQEEMDVQAREEREAAERERAERERAMAEEADRLMKGKADPKLNPRRFFANNAKLDGKARKEEVEKCRELMQRLMATEAARFLQAVWRGRGPRRVLKALKDIERAKLEATKQRLAEAAEKIARNKERERLAARLKEISATEAILRDVWSKWRERAAIKMQAHFRGAMARKHFAARMAQHRRDCEAAKEARKRAWVERQERWVLEAKQARRKAWDAEVAAMRERVALMDLERRERELAALRLQSALRGQLERRKLRKSGKLMEDRLKAAAEAEKKKQEEAAQRRQEAIREAEERKRQQEVLKAQEAIRDLEFRWKTYHATKIQSIVRARNDRRRAAAEKAKKEAEANERRAAARREEERRRRLEEEKRAQEALRAQQMGVGAMRKLLAEMEDRRLGQYVIKLQARWRGRMARRRYAEVKEIIKREKQKARDLKRARHLAEWKEQKRLEELRRKERRQREVSTFSKRLHDVEFIQKTRAARRIQGAYRVRRAKLQLRNLKHEREEKEYSKRAAVKLKIERERLQKLEEQKAKEATAKAKLQREVQGYRHKVDAMEFRAQEQAAIRIQAIMKGSVQRLRFATAKKLAKERYDMEQSKEKLDKRVAEELRRLEEQRKATQLKLEEEQRKMEEKYRIERERADQKKEEEKAKLEKKLEKETERLEKERVKMEEAIQREREKLEQEREALMEQMDGALPTGSGSRGPTMPYKSAVKASMEMRKEEHILAKERQLEATLKKLAESQEAAAVAAASAAPAPGALLEEARPPSVAACVAAQANKMLHPGATEATMASFTSKPSAEEARRHTAPPTVFQAGDQSPGRPSPGLCQAAPASMARPQDLAPALSRVQAPLAPVQASAPEAAFAAYAKAGFAPAMAAAQAPFLPAPAPAPFASPVREGAAGQFPPAVTPTLPAAALQQPPEALFDQLDRNRDGVLSREEFLRIQEVTSPRDQRAEDALLWQSPSEVASPTGLFTFEDFHTRLNSGLMTEEALVAEIDRRQLELQGLHQQLAQQAAEEEKLRQQVSQPGRTLTCRQCDERTSSLKLLFRSLAIVTDMAVQLHLPPMENVDYLVDPSEPPLPVIHDYLLQLADVAQSCGEVDQRFGQLAAYSKQKAAMIQAHLASTPPPVEELMAAAPSADAEALAVEAPHLPMQAPSAAAPAAAKAAGSAAEPLAAAKPRWRPQPRRQRILQVV